MKKFFPNNWFRIGVVAIGLWICVSFTIDTLAPYSRDEEPSLYIGVAFDGKKLTYSVYDQAEQNVFGHDLCIVSGITREEATRIIEITNRR